MGARGEDTVVDEQILVGARDEGGESADDLERVEEEVAGAVVPRGLEGEANAAVGEACEAVVGDGGAGAVAEHAFEHGDTLP
jgi:hypothetical protein